MGYPRETLGYYFYNRQEGKVFVARHGTFLEKEFLTRKASGRTVQLEEVWDKPLGEDSASDAITVEPVREPVVEVAPAPWRLERLCNASNVLLLDNDEPLTYAEAMVDPDSELWLEAMRPELKSMDGNQVWNLFDLPNGAWTIEWKWIFKKKLIWMEMFRSIKLDLSRRGFDKFKELTTTRLSRRQRCLNQFGLF